MVLCLRPRRKFTPSVIEPSFGVGRIIYCMLEHSFYTRPGSDDRHVFRRAPPSLKLLCCTSPHPCALLLRACPPFTPHAPCSSENPGSKPSATARKQGVQAARDAPLQGCPAAQV